METGSKLLYDNSSGAREDSILPPAAHQSPSHMDRGSMWGFMHTTLAQLPGAQNSPDAYKIPYPDTGIGSQISCSAIAQTNEAQKRTGFARREQLERVAQ